MIRSPLCGELLNRNLLLKTGKFQGLLLVCFKDSAKTKHVFFLCGGFGSCGIRSCRSGVPLRQFPCERGFSTADLIYIERKFYQKMYEHGVMQYGNTMRNVLDDKNFQ